MGGFKVMTIVGTRPEVIKLSRVIAELDRHTKHVLVHTGQNYDYELNEIFFKELGVRRPDYFLEAAGKSAAQTIGAVISRSDEIIAKECPKALLVLGDTNSCLAVIAAKRRKVPIFHMEAGNRCFDQRVPEEINRKLVDQLSDINMPYTEHARRYLLSEGIRPDTIIKTGSPMKEVLAYYMPTTEKSNVLSRIGLRPNGFFLVSMHREENVDNDVNFGGLLASLNAIAKKYGKPIIISTHPRTRNRLEELSPGNLSKELQFLKPLGFLDYIKLQMQAFCVLSDSGTITEECSILNFPAVTIREAHERPEGMDEGTLIMSGLNAERVMQSIEIVTSQYLKSKRQFELVADYDTESVSKKVVRIIISYTDYVNRVVWHK
ncbi:MAG: UDP-N-acetylglucosamine 2-epimerase (non-hydrolyzing) [Gammaproteobacteria bacterium]|nr:UDP-N-acetylglucosamine 2-epimerase (non-hydrolyzing) [Gammaproteobacteria bacterium]